MPKHSFRNILEELDDTPGSIVVQDGSIQVLACQIHFGYGGSDLDNWFEVE
jgi:hypothetical protein